MPILHLAQRFGSWPVIYQFYVYIGQIGFTKPYCQGIIIVANIGIDLVLSMKMTWFLYFHLS